MPEPDAPTTVGLTVDGRAVEARPDELLIDACERVGVYIPRFCYHPRMEPVGMCRMCVVEVDTGRGPSLLPSCMLNVTDGMTVDTASGVTKKAQDGILEFLLINHPLDCPVCDKGGECPLQDQAMSHGPGESRFVEEKRHFEKPIAISDLVDLDRERCILCDRCTRFAKDVAGDPLISFVDRGNQTEINTFPGHPFASYFSGNTVQICPVGALTARSYRFKARPWDLDKTESTCQSCSVGCRITIETSRNEVLRYSGVDVDPVNWGWLCDKGRFDFEAVNSDERLRSPLLRRGDQLVEGSWADALRATAGAVTEGLERSGPDGVAVIGGARLTNEDAYAWTKLAKGVIGTDNVDAQLGDGLPPDAVLGLPRATIDDACRAGGTILLIGPDPKEELPVLFLRLRHAVERDGARLVQVVPARGPTSELAAATVTYRPGEVAEVVTALLDGPASGAGEGGQLERGAQVLAGEGPLTVVLGRGNLAESAELVATAAGAVHEARPGARFLSALRRGNVHGALDAGMSPGLLPGRVRLEDGREWFRGRWPTLPEHEGLDTIGVLQAAAEGRIDTLFLVGADPLADVPDHDLARRGLAGARTVVALDTFLTDSGRTADVVVPVAGFAECDGTTTNIEGRVSTLNPKVTPPGTARSDWMIASDVAARLGADLGLESVGQIWDELASLSPVHDGITRAMLDSPAFGDGILTPFETAVRISTPPTVDAPDADIAPEVTDLDIEVAGITAVGITTEDPVAGLDTTAGPGSTATEPTDETRETGESEDPGTGEVAEDASQRSPKGARPPTITFRDRRAVAPAVDAYSLRVVATRRLYDLGTMVQRSKTIAHLATETHLGLHPHDFDRLGIEPGDTARVVTSRTDGTEVVCHADPAVPRGAAHVVFNQPGLRASELIDASTPVTEIRVETL